MGLHLCGFSEVQGSRAARGSRLCHLLVRLMDALVGLSWGVGGLGCHAERQVMPLLTVRLPLVTYSWLTLLWGLGWGARVAGHPISIVISHVGATQLSSTTPKYWPPPGAPDLLHLTNHGCGAGAGTSRCVLRGSGKRIGSQAA